MIRYGQQDNREAICIPTYDNLGCAEVQLVTIKLSEAIGS